MFRWIGAQADRLQAGLTLWGMLGGTAVIGAVTGWAAQASVWISQWGPIGWIAAGFAGAFAFLFLVWAIVRVVQVVYWVRHRQRMYAAHPQIDPSETHFVNKRIYIESLLPPFPGSLEGKTFQSCEIIGPMNLYPVQCTIIRSLYVSCDYIAIDPGAVPRVFNARQITKCHFVDCRFYNLSFLVKDDEFHGFNVTGGCNWITRVPQQQPLPLPFVTPPPQPVANLASATSSQPPPGTGPGTPP